MDHELGTVSVGASRSTTTADPEVPPLPDNKKLRVEITDISFSGHVARQQSISLVPTESNDDARALQDLPDLDEHHARIYDTIAGESTSLLGSHLGPLFNTVPRNGHSIEFPLDREGRNEAQGTMRSQWSQTPVSTSSWNILPIPCTDFLVRKQYDKLELAPSPALISCRAKETNKLLGECIQCLDIHLAKLYTVLYERPYSADEELMSRALGQMCPDIFGHSIFPDDGRSRVMFVKLLLLGLFHHHINRLSSIRYETFYTGSYEMLWESGADDPKTIIQLRNWTVFHKSICQLTNMAEFTAKNLELELEPLGSSQKSLKEYMLETRYSSAQLNQLSQDNMERYQHGWDTYREFLNVQRSQDVKRLTLLATIFLPLSLPSSILAMNTRFKDLGLLLYDYVGVFFIIGSLALILYIIILFGNKVVIFAGRQLRSRFALKNSESREFDMAILLGRVRYHGFAWFGIAWFSVTSSFLFSMFSDDWEG